MIAFSSYNKRDNKILRYALAHFWYLLAPLWLLWLSIIIHHRDVLSICILNSATSILAGFAIFSILGYIAENQGSEVKDVVSEGKSHPLPSMLRPFLTSCPGPSFHAPPLFPVFPQDSLWASLFHSVVCVYCCTLLLFQVQGLCSLCIQRLSLLWISLAATFWLSSSSSCSSVWPLTVRWVWIQSDRHHCFLINSSVALGTYSCASQ